LFRYAGIKYAGIKYLILKPRSGDTRPKAASESGCRGARRATPRGSGLPLRLPPQHATAAKKQYIVKLCTAFLLAARPKTSSEKLRQKNFVRKTSSEKLRQKNFVRKTSSEKLRQKNFVRKTSLEKLR
jgi:hypothetical protein